MNCSECLEDLVAYLEGLLRAEQEMRLQAHLESCKACRVEYQAFAHLRRLLVNLGRARRTPQEGEEL
jgi:anti-sigma factor RsiW